MSDIENKEVIKTPVQHRPDGRGIIFIVDADGFEVCEVLRLPNHTGSDYNGAAFKIATAINDHDRLTRENESLREERDRYMYALTELRDESVREGIVWKIAHQALAGKED